MDTLPEECLLHLLSFVSIDPRSLHSLLLTSKAFFRLVTPILYQNPLQYVETQLHHLQHSQPRQATALRLLLTTSPDTLRLLSTYRSGGTPSLPRRPTIDYLSLYTFHSEKLLLNIMALALPSARRSLPTMLIPADTQESPDGVVATHEPALAPAHSPSTLQGGRPYDLVQVHARVHLGLVSHSPQNIHTIGFSTHNISVLQPLVKQLSRLARLELLKRNHRQDLTGAQIFIRAHRQQFSTLREIQIDVHSALDRSDLSSLIIAMVNPRVVDVAHWSNADQYLDQFPLQDCCTLLMRRTTPLLTSILDPAILSTLPQLRILRMSVFHQDIFSWAATRVRQVNATTDHKMRKPNHHAGLTSLSLQGQDKLLVPALVDACDGFRESIQELSGLSNFGDPTPLCLAWSWMLPRLSYLELEGTIAVHFDLVSLRYCPVLVELRLNIVRRIPGDWDVLQKATQLACVSPSLRRLELSGYWALPDSALEGVLLPLVKRLHRLNLTWCTGPSSRCLIRLLPQLTTLRWLGISATAEEQEEILGIKSPVMDIDVRVA